MTIPRATVRLQFHEHFTLDDAAATVDYYAALGISHFYASPLLTARPGSTHGYDIVDPTRINPELGGEPALRRLVDRLRNAHMGLILDIVPNHMGVGGPHNPWWQHVLEWGQDSPYSGWFDIDWKPSDPALRGKILMPFLGEPYGDVLDAGDLVLRFDTDNGKILIGYHAHRFPLTPADHADVLLTAGADILEPAIAAFQNIRAGDTMHSRQQHADAAFGLLTDIARSADGRAAIDTALANFSAQQDLQQLHLLLERQHYRLAWWRNAAEEINWRRFFEVTDLAGVRVERDDVFDATHALILRLYAEGLIDGVRIDHIDGLADPRAYCCKLRERLEQLTPQRPEGLNDSVPYIIAEKILSKGEELRGDWLLDGATGYEFMDQVGALLHDPAGMEPLDALWRSVSGDTADFRAEVRDVRRQLLAENLAGELEATARCLHAIARSDLHTRDFSLTAIRRVLTELLVFFPVYRTYVGDTNNGGSDPIDQRILNQTMQDIRQYLRPADHRLLALVGEWLGGSADESSDADIIALRRKATTRFQQLTPPLTAKSVEDTAFYRYGRLLSRNDVGSDPGQFSADVADFHAACGARAQRFPHTMLTTATHDHKRGEDTRARLAVFSEIPDEWQQAVSHWMTLNTPLRKEIFSEDRMRVLHAPHPADEMTLYQMLAGAWPIDLAADDEAGLRAFAQRIDQWQTKALRETKRASSWTQPNEDYENACREFLFDMLDVKLNRHFLSELTMWLPKIFAPGAVNSITQTVLRLSSPGVPDLYQGTDFWDFSLVDPDNRRPVDHAARTQSLADAIPVDRLLETWRDGRLKQQIIHRALKLRACLPELFSDGDYVPLSVTGPLADHVVALLRTHGQHRMIAVTVRFPAHLLGHTGTPTIPAEKWDGTSIALPDELDGEWSDGLSGQQLQVQEGSLPLGHALSNLPAALLHAKFPG